MNRCLFSGSSGATRALRGAVAVAILTLAAIAHAEDESPIDFALPDLSGETVAMADYRGQWLVLNYWATWCKPCIKEFPELDAIHRERDDVTVLGLNFEQVETSRLERFLEKHTVSFPILRVDVLSPPAVLGDPRGLPMTFIVDPAGVLRETIYGPVTAASLGATIDELAEAG